MNPSGCAAQARAILDRAGLKDRVIATVSGDDLLPRLDELLASGHPLTNLDTGEPLAAIRERVVSANAYLGARPIAEALRRGASVVITGRVADASLTVGPAMHEFGWAWDDWDRLAAATVAGHLIECGAQATGGLWCNWPEAPDLADVGYPIADMEPDGSFSITKPPATGGAVNRETVSEQLLYEVGDPAAYLTPDVVADFTSVTLAETGRDEVRVDRFARQTGDGQPQSFDRLSRRFRRVRHAAGLRSLRGGERPALRRDDPRPPAPRRRRAGASTISNASAPAIACRAWSLPRRRRRRWCCG